jgi:cell wall-associated NlpC family hydrolase
MRLGRPSLFALVLLVLGFPLAAAAEETQLGAAEAVENVTAQQEHMVLSVAGEAAEETRRARRLGRPRVVAIAMRYLGIPYRWAGSSPSGFDCSGFVMYVYSRLGVELPHSSWMLWSIGRPVARRDLRPGDVVFFNGRSHVGIYVGRGRFIHSPHSGDVVRVQSMSESRYRATYDGARRP